MRAAALAALAELAELLPQSDRHVRVLPCLRAAAGGGEGDAGAQRSLARLFGPLLSKVLCGQLDADPVVSAWKVSADPVEHRSWASWATTVRWAPTWRPSARWPRQKTPAAAPRAPARCPRLCSRRRPAGAAPIRQAPPLCHRHGNVLLAERLLHCATWLVPVISRTRLLFVAIWCNIPSFLSCIYLQCVRPWKHFLEDGCCDRPRQAPAPVAHAVRLSVLAGCIPPLWRAPAGHAAQPRGARVADGAVQQC